MKHFRIFILFDNKKKKKMVAVPEGSTILIDTRYTDAMIPNLCAKVDLYS